MGKIIDLIKNFIEPKEQHSFEELASDSGLTQSQLEQLKKSMNGISWSAFSRENEESISKKAEKSRNTVLNKMNNEMDLKEKKSIRNNEGLERE